MAVVQACKLVFSSCQLQPMGSYPRVCDKKGSHDLFGPASKIYCADFDRAVCLYLACLKVPPAFSLNFQLFTRFCGGTLHLEAAHKRRVLSSAKENKRS